MELVGRQVKKRFPGLGQFSGVVESYDPVAGYFGILYEDGDSEEVDFGEIAGMLMEMGEEVPPSLAMRPIRRSERGRRSKKRRRSELDAAARDEDVDLGGGTGKGGVLEGNGGSSVWNLEGGGGSDARPLTQGNGGCPNEGNFGVQDENFGQVKVCLAGTEDVDMFGDENASLGSNENIHLGKVKSREADLDDQLKEGFYTSTESTDIHRSKKRRRPVSSNVSSSPPVPLRRSARRVHSSLLSPPGQTIRINELDNQAIACGEFIDEELKPELPPSSTDLDLDGMSIPDFFSVYSCLRSFSRLLFLSPFSLEAFLAALRCKFANSLIDSVHFSILQTLRSHLELLAEEGSKSATRCIRSLNWDLLDLITWPLFLAQYMLFHGSKMASKCKLSHLKLLDVEYYKHPANMKLEILCYLCDDVVEVEAIRTELNTRSKDSDPNMDFSDFINSKKNELTPNAFRNPLDQETSEGTTDWNSDECCLCNMDGSLICCDGCPAAFHSKCVGVAKDLLPEGDWFCPECMMDKCDGLAKMSKSPQGAEILVTDPHGRLYFSSCGYLLVCDSCDAFATYHFYNKGDLYALTKKLKSSGTSYGSVVNAISSHWENAIENSDARKKLDLVISDGEETFDALSHSSKLLSSGPKDYVNTIAHDSSLESAETKNISASDLNQPNMVKASQSQLTACSLQSSKNADEIAHTVNSVQLCQQSTTNCYDDSGSPVKEVIPVKPVNLAIQNKRCFGVAGWSDTSFISEKKKDGTSQLQFDGRSYVNDYSFGRIASSVAKEVIQISSYIDCKELKTDDDIVSAQTKIILKRSIGSCLHNDLRLSLDLQKEKCGWCHACKTCSSNKCIFVVSDETSKSRTIGVRSGKKKKSHIISATRQILSIESNLRGLLSGIWDNPHQSSNWRKAVLKASDVSSLRHFLLTLEHNLRRVALSPEWMKPNDFSYIIGSTSQVLMNCMEVSSSSATRKQRKKTVACPDSRVMQVAITFNTWWRGGKLSRQLFHWNTIPHSLAFKGGRQAGCKTISSLIYPDGSDFAKISKCLSWRASVEMSKTVSQLTFNIKELSSNIRWSEFSKSQHSLNMTKELKSSANLFKKVIIQRKCINGIDIKYLLDFGKRGNIPPLVTKNGDIFEDSASDRKKYWLNEAHVPLNLIKAFEEKKLACILKKHDPKLPSKKQGNPIMPKHQRSKDLSYLFKRAEQLESKLCGLCKKDVLIRDAVSCQICNGFFHRKHFRLPKRSTAATYICYSCKGNLSVKSNLKGKEVVNKEEKTPMHTKFKSMSKKRKRTVLQNKRNTNGEKKGKKNKNKKAQAKKTKNSITCAKRKRTKMQHSFWLNGLLWTRKPDDVRGKHFRERKVLLPFQTLNETLLQPICCLCFKDYNPEVIYVFCENCQDWFHGDAYGLTLDNIDSVVGFKCHNCRRARDIPTCPFSQNVTFGALKSSEVHTIVESVIPEYQGIEELHHSGTIEESDFIVDSQNCLDLQKDTDITCAKDEVPFDCKTVLPTVLHDLQSPNSEDAKVKSSCLEHAINVEGSEKKELTNEIAGDSEFHLSNVSNASTDPHL